MYITFIAALPFGHLWQGRFKSAAVEGEGYFLGCAGSIERNPLTAGLVGEPAKTKVHVPFSKPSRPIFRTWDVYMIDQDCQWQLDSWIKALKDPRAEVRQEATSQIGNTGPKAASAVAALTKVLQDSDAGVREGAAWALAEIGPGAMAAVPALVCGLKDKEPGVRHWMTIALARIGPDAHGAFPALVEALADDDPSVRDGAAVALERIGPAAAQASWRTSGEPMDYWAEVIRSDDVFMRAQAALMLGYSDPGAAASIREALDDETVLVRRAAAAALVSMAVVPETVVAGAIKDPDEDVRMFATKAIGRIDSVPLALFVEMLQDRAARVRIQAAHSLKQLGRVAVAALPAIVAALRDEAAPVRMWAAAALKAMGPEARPAYLALLEVLTNDEDEGVRRYVSRALDEVGRPDNKDMELAIEALLKALKHADDEVCSVAAMAIARIGPDGQRAVPLLLQAVQDRPVVRFWAICALRSIGPLATAAVPILVHALKDENASIRSVSAQALGKIGANSQAVASALGEAMKDINQEVRLWAAQALVAIGAQSESCVPVLEEVLSCPSANREIRKRAAESLCQLGTGKKGESD